MYEDFDDEFSDEGEEQEIFFNIIHRYIGLFSGKAHRQTKNDTANEYPFIAMDSRQVFAQIKFVSQYLLARDGQEKSRSYSFMDVGCGMGNVLLIAEQFGFDVFGIEKDEYPLTIAWRLFDKERVVEEDIRTYAHYERFDVIYYFCPFSDGDMQRRFERHIENEMKPGAILIANHKRSEEIEGDPRFKRLETRYNIWEKLSAG